MSAHAVGTRTGSSWWPGRASQETSPAKESNLHLHDLQEHVLGHTPRTSLVAVQSVSGSKPCIRTALTPA
eukprot:1157731-Pelagomonas_calceolata.AAC.13